ncbi:YgfZ/GcvT domain-containing protein [Marisediminicola sp. LYQ134]|uniref:CAF17-like 4Fe-4S cluster assembly/insertion protein YgfZ n=1 Tax=Marisediminicola sp. LYQ134 TaxID=3391061 RepID=UPI0039835F76
MSSEFLARPGAVEAGDLGVAAHYGDPFREQRALAAGDAIVDLSHRAIVTVSGPDRLTWIDSITSQSVARLAPGESSETLVLDQNGRLEYAAGLIDDGDTLWMLVDAASAPGLVAWLDRMRFMLRVEVADRSADFAAIGSRAGIATAATPHGVPLDWRDPWSAVSPGGYQYAAEAEHPALDWQWTEQIVERERLAEIAAGYPLAGLLAYEALRIAAWRPARDTEVDEKSIPHELDWLRTAVHLNKGCYRGQETVAKVHNLGHPPRRLVMLHLDGSDDVLPIAGDDVLLGDVVVGHVTAAAQHFELGPIALAVIKRTTDASAALRVLSKGTEVAAAQETIVPTDAGAVADVARLPRLGAVRR